MNVRHNALPAAVLSAGLLAGGCGGNEAPEPQDTYTVPPVPLITEEPPVYAPIKMGDMKIRVIQAEDPTSKSAGAAHEELAENTIGRVSRIAARSTNDQWQLRFGEAERVVLDYKASQELCDVSESAPAWENTLEGVRDDILEAAPNAKDEKYDTTLISYGFKTCQPQAEGDPQRKDGEASQQAKVIDIPQGIRNSRTVLHQLGHYYGLGHARLNTCDLDGAGAYCFETNKTYADPTNIMGSERVPDQDVFSSPQLDRTHVLDPDQIVNVTRSGNFILGSLMGGSDKPRALRIKAGGHQLTGPAAQEYYYVELSGDTAGRTNQGVSLKVYRAAEVSDPPQMYPSTLLYKLNSGPEVGATRASKEPVFMAAGGLRVVLRSIVQDPNDVVGGTASIAVKMPQ